MRLLASAKDQEIKGWVRDREWVLFSRRETSNSRTQDVDE